MEKKCGNLFAGYYRTGKLNFRLYDDNDAGTPDDNRPGLSNPAQRRIRYSVIDFSNPSPEVIWADTRKEGYYDIQNRSIPLPIY